MSRISYVFSLIVLMSACRVEPVLTPIPDADGDGFDQAQDCNDDDGLVFPGATEICDGIDNDCNGQVDDGAEDAQVFYVDIDGDGFGAASVSLSACDAPAGYVAESGDCDDTNDAINPQAVESDCTDPVDYNCDGSVGFSDVDADGFAACLDCDDSLSSVNPDAVELCDGVDNDCDTLIDELGAVGEKSWYADADADGFGDVFTMQVSCDAPDGYISDDRDCDDRSDLVSPVGVEVCDGLDNNCDGRIDGVDSMDVSVWYGDGDGDGYGTSKTSIKACFSPVGFVSNADDCDDEHAEVYKGAIEVCDQRDNNCDGQVDESFNTTWYIDYDQDGYGASAVTTQSCAQPSGFVRSADDCDDTRPSAYPGAIERCNGLDDACTGVPLDEFDGDGDGFRICEGDCDDVSPSVNPDAVEIWYDGVDQNCDAASDYDQDGDGHDTLASGGDDVNDRDVSCWQSCSDGSARDRAVQTCSILLRDFPDRLSGLYWVDPDGDADHSNAFQSYCDMATDGGGWTLASYGHAGAITTSSLNANHHSLKCGGGQWSPASRANSSASVNAVALAHASLEVAFSMTVDGSAVVTGGLQAYERAYRFLIPDPAKVSFINHSYLGANWGVGAGQAGACVAVTVDGIHGVAGSWTKYTLENVLGTSWTDSYPTGYGVSNLNTCVDHDGGPFFTSIHTGVGHLAVYGAAISECDISGGSLTYVHRGQYSHNSVNLTGASAIWFR